MKSWEVENVVTLACIVVLTLGLYWLGAGGHSFWALALMLNLNYKVAK